MSELMCTFPQQEACSGSIYGCQPLKGIPSAPSTSPHPGVVLSAGRQPYFQFYRRSQMRRVWSELEN